MSVPLAHKKHKNNIFSVVLLIVGCSFLIAVLLLHNSASTSCDSLTFLENHVQPVVKQKFKGVQYWKQGVTQSVRTLYETAFCRFQIHSVLLEDGKTVVDDWMWCDEGDHVNVLVEREPSSKDASPSYLIFRQTKYAMQGKTLAIVGGFVDPGETPEETAKRELKEELNMISTEWLHLGSFRAAANRGGGHTHTFLARKVQPLSSSYSTVADNRNLQKGGMVQGESERQDVLEVSREELLEALMAGKFQEIKWTATIALAILKTSHIK